MRLTWKLLEERVPIDERSAIIASAARTAAAGWLARLSDRCLQSIHPLRKRTRQGSGEPLTKKPALQWPRWPWSACARRAGNGTLLEKYGAFGILWSWKPPCAQRPGRRYAPSTDTQLVDDASVLRLAHAVTSTAILQSMGWNAWAIRVARLRPRISSRKPDIIDCRAAAPAYPSDRCAGGISMMRSGRSSAGSRPDGVRRMMQRMTDNSHMRLQAQQGCASLRRAGRHLSHHHGMLTMPGEFSQKEPACHTPSQAAAAPPNRSSAATGDATVIDVNPPEARSRGIRFSPFYPHGGIPVPCSPERRRHLARTEGLCLPGMSIHPSLPTQPMRGLKRSTRQLGAVLGHRAGLRGDQLLTYAEARRLIYLPTYRWVLDHRLQDELAELRRLGAAQLVLLLDYETMATLTI